MINVMRKIDLSYQKNVRDLGGLVAFNGKKVKEGRIYRGGFLGRVSEDDIPIVDSSRTSRRILTVSSDVKSVTPFWIAQRRIATPSSKWTPERIARVLMM